MKNGGPGGAKPAATSAPVTAARARNVLVIEDEVLIAMVLEDMLDMLGYRVVGTAATLAEAEAAIAAGGFDAVIADVNLGSEPIYPLAERVIAAGTPLILATGSHPDLLPPQFAAVPVLEKPYAFAAVELALAKIA